MTLSPIECEARLMGLSKTRRKDGDWFEAKFHIHPDDMARLSALFLLPLGTACNLSIKGTTEAAAEPTQTQAAPETVEDAPKKEHRSWDEVSPREQACIRCNESKFGEWLQQHMKLEGVEISTKQMLYQYLGIGSRRAIVDGSEHARNWHRLDAYYLASGQETQLRNGPS